jgi:hypothetical protein
MSPSVFESLEVVEILEYLIFFRENLKFTIVIFFRRQRQEFLIFYAFILW